MLSRRALLTLSSGAAAAGISAKSAASQATHTLVVVFQRFAADWLNLLVPAGDPAYGPARPNLAVNTPIPLDSFFGLHPQLAPLKPAYDAGDLAFIAATGWISPELIDRSHFYAQQIMEAGSAPASDGGWLTRFVQQDAAFPSGLWSALAAERSVPNSLQGTSHAIAVADFNRYQHFSVMGDAATNAARDLGVLAEENGQTLVTLCDSLVDAKQNGYGAPTDATYPATRLGGGLQVAAQAIKRGLAPRVITVTSDDDWDTHVNQAARHERSLPSFAQALASFYDDLGDHLNDVTVVTMTEFGRRVRESAGGTDHGTGSSMMVMSRRIAGAQVYGTWPGLASDQLWRGQDLRPTTDYRTVLSEILSQHMGLADTSLEGVFQSPLVAREHWLSFTL